MQRYYYNVASKVMYGLSTVLAPIAIPQVRWIMWDRYRKSFFAALGAGFSLMMLFGAQATFAFDARVPDVKIYASHTLTLSNTFAGLDGAFRGGMSVAVGDVTGDGNQNIVVGALAGGGPQVVVYDAAGNQISSFRAYDARMNKGVNVAVGDFDGNGVSDIVTATSNGIVHARIFDYRGVEKNIAGGFFPYGVRFSGGADVAAGDIDGDGDDEILFGSLIGSHGHVRGFDGNGDYTGFDLFPHAPSHKGGVSVATANIDGGPEDEVIVGVHDDGESWVKVYKTDATRRVVSHFRAFPEGFKGGVTLAGADVDQDGFDELLIAARAGGGPHIQFFEATGEEIRKDIMAYENDFRGGTDVASGDLNNDGIDEIIVVPTKKRSHLDRIKQEMAGRGGAAVVASVPGVGKFIEVDLSEQRLRAYENGEEVKTFLVSTGISRFPTPTGSYAVSARLPVHDYVWSYGDGNPDNYDIPDVWWNLRWADHLYIHSATWHNDFGHPRSHGCINVHPANAEWIYRWTPVNTPVLVHD